MRDLTRNIRQSHDRILNRVIFTISLLTLVGCDLRSNVWTPCEPLPLVDGYRTIKLKKTNITLKLPGYVDLRRRYSEEEDEGCEYVKSMFITLLWHEGKLMPYRSNLFKTPEGQRVKVYYFLAGTGNQEDWLNRPSRLKPWRFDSARPHTRFPLEYYPKFYWDDPVNPSEKSLKRARSTATWGIRHTRYKNNTSSGRFLASCPITVRDKTDLVSPISADVAKNGAAACQFGMNIEHQDDYIFGLLRVYANLGSNQQGIMQINQIVDAMIEELYSYIEE